MTPEREEEIKAAARAEFAARSFFRGLRYANSALASYEDCERLAVTYALARAKMIEAQNELTRLIEGHTSVTNNLA